MHSALKTGTEAYLDAGGATLHGSAKHDPGVLVLFQLNSRLPQSD